MARAFISLTSVAALLTLTSTGAFAAKSAADFIKDAIQGDNSEIMLGQLAQQKAGNQQVRDFGKTLVSDHTQAKQEASAVAKTLGVTPPDQPMSEAKDEQAKLSKMSGDGFDQEFASYMVKDHQQDIQEFQDQAKANAGPTSALATKQLPVLQKHLQMAEALTGNAAQNGSAAPAVMNDAPTQESPDQWRASKLAGVWVYGPDNKKVGNITDILMSKDGKAEYVVVGVGGFLGIGEKDVAIPYDQVKFTNQPIAPATGSAANPNGTTTGAATGGGMAPATAVGLGTPADTTGNANANTTAGVGTATGVAPPAPAMTLGVGTDANGTAVVPATVGAPASGGAGANRSAAYPDHGMIDMTAEQLKSAPSFHFAP